MKRDLRLIHTQAGGARRPLQRAACLCVLPLALVPLLPRAAWRHVVSVAPPSLAASRAADPALGPGDCEQYRRAYRLCLAAGSAPSPQRGEAEGQAISPRLLPGPESGVMPSCDELRGGARQRLASMNCKL